jgi:hypothetical protein
MSLFSSQNLLPPIEKLREACQTISGLAPPTDQFVARLQLIAKLLADSGPLPPVPLLVWREESEDSVRHAPLEDEFVVGRMAGAPGLSLASDKLLSRRHFVIHAEGVGFSLEDLNSHNGTSINRTRNSVQRHFLHDGDVIFAGDHLFVFLDQRRTT